MSAPAEREQKTLADLYRDRDLTDAQVRRVVALLRLTDRPARQGTERTAS